MYPGVPRLPRQNRSSNLAYARQQKERNCLTGLTADILKLLTLVLLLLSDALADSGGINAAEAGAVLFYTMALSVLPDLAADPAVGTPAPLVAFRHISIVARGPIDRRFQRP